LGGDGYLMQHQPPAATALNTHLSQFNTHPAPPPLSPHQPTPLSLSHSFL